MHITDSLKIVEFNNIEVKTCDMCGTKIRFQDTYATRMVKTATSGIKYLSCTACMFMYRQGQDLGLDLVTPDDVNEWLATRSSDPKVADLQARVKVRRNAAVWDTEPRTAPTTRSRLKGAVERHGGTMEEISDGYTLLAPRGRHWTDGTHELLALNENDRYAFMTGNPIPLHSMVWADLLPIVWLGTEACTEECDYWTEA